MRDYQEASQAAGGLGIEVGSGDSQAADDRRTVIRGSMGVEHGGDVAAERIADGRKASERAIEQNSLRRALLRPLADLVKADPDAARALERLREIERDPARRRYGPTGMTPRSGSGPVPDLSNLDPGLNFFSPPYDWQRVGPSSGFGYLRNAADLYAGTWHTEGQGAGADGFMFTSSGLALDLVPKRDGHLDFRPYITTDNWGYANGYGLSSHIEAHIITTAFDDAGHLVAMPTDYTVFSVDNDATPNDSPTLSAPWVSIRFAVRANRVYQVWVEGVVKGDQSGVYEFANSSAGAWMNCRMPFVVADLQ